MSLLHTHIYLSCPKCVLGDERGGRRVHCIVDFFLSVSKNPFGVDGMARVLKSLAYSPSIEEVWLTDLSSMTRSSAISTALAKLFELTVTLQKVFVFCSSLFSQVPCCSSHSLARSLTHSLTHYLPRSVFGAVASA